MPLTVVEDFSGCLNGHMYCCKKGEPFKGTKLDGAILLRCGLLATKTEKKEAKK